MCSVWVEISLYWQLLDHRQTVLLLVNKETNQWDFFIRKEYSKLGKEILNLFGNWSREYLAGCQIDHLSAAAAPNIRKSASQARSYIKIQAFLFPELSKKFTKYMFPRKSQKCSWSEIIWHFLYPSKYDMQSTNFILWKYLQGVLHLEMKKEIIHLKGNIWEERRKFRSPVKLSMKSTHAFHCKTSPVNWTVLTFKLGHSTTLVS